MKSVEEDLKSIGDWLKKADKLMTSYESSGKDFESNMATYNVSIIGPIRPTLILKQFLVS